jgi:hypothetical protein
MKKRLFIGMIIAFLSNDGFSQAVGTPYFPFSLPKGLVMSKTGRIWMDKNLGATRVATSSYDTLSFGFYFQWGRGADGHQERLSIPYNYNNEYYLSNVWKNASFPWREGSNKLSGSNQLSEAISSFKRDNPGINAKYITQSFEDSPGHNYFIHIRELNDLNGEFEFNSNTKSYTHKFNDFDWRYPSNDDLWQGVNGTNNPCPPKFRLPTSAEWEEEAATWGLPNAVQSAFNSPLKLPVASYRVEKMGYFFEYYWGVPVNNDGYPSTIGKYWSSSIVNTDVTFILNGDNTSKIQHDAKYFHFETVYNLYAENLDEEYTYSKGTDKMARSNAMPVRCILDENYLPRDLTYGDYSIFSNYSNWHR